MAFAHGPELQIDSGRLIESSESATRLSTSCQVDNAEWYNPQLKEEGSVWLEPSAEMGRHRVFAKNLAGQSAAK
jgi:hypothetical protein